MSSTDWEDRPEGGGAERVDPDELGDVPPGTADEETAGGESTGGGWTTPETGAGAEDIPGAEPGEETGRRQDDVL